MSFEQHKKHTLEKMNSKDKSKKGSVDKHIKKLVDTINTKEDYCTTSSCSGRTLLFKESASGKKQDTEWLFVSHDTVELEEIKTRLKPTTETVWFKFEPYIIHVSCKDIESAQKLISLLRDSGFKRAGIISLSKKITIEVIGNERIDTPIISEEGILVEEKYLEFLVNEANKKLETNHSHINKMYEMIKKEL